MISRLRARLSRWLANPVVLFAAIFPAIASLTRLSLALFSGMQSAPGYHIPMIFYAPGLLKPGRIEGVASQIDVPPTLLETLGLPGDDHFFGQSVFEKNQMAPRAFISNYQEPGYYKNGKLIVLGPKKRADAFIIGPHTFEAKRNTMDDRLQRSCGVLQKRVSRLQARRNEIALIFCSRLARLIFGTIRL